MSGFAPRYLDGARSLDSERVCIALPFDFAQDFGSGLKRPLNASTSLEMTGLKADRNVRATQTSAIFAVEKVAHCFASGGVRALVSLQGIGGAGTLVRRVLCLGGGALRTVVGKTRLIGLEFELLRTDCADFDGKGHSNIYGNRACEDGSTPWRYSTTPSSRSVSIRSISRNSEHAAK